MSIPSPPSSTRRRKRRAVQIFLLAFLVTLVFDFMAFSNRAANLAENAVSPVETDAVIVLTGGGHRLSTAAVLARDLNAPLFISGVNPESPDEDVAAAAGLDEDFMACCVTSGRSARTTAENGLEVAQWAIYNDHDRLVVVTSGYHMERALIELRSRMPDIKLSGFAVSSPVINERYWWKDLRSARRMSLEWAKWRVVSVRESLAGRRSGGQNSANSN